MNKLIFLVKWSSCYIWPRTTFLNSCSRPWHLWTYPILGIVAGWTVQHVGQALIHHTRGWSQSLWSDPFGLSSASLWLLSCAKFKFNKSKCYKVLLEFPIQDLTLKPGIQKNYQKGGVVWNGVIFSLTFFKMIILTFYTDIQLIKYPGAVKKILWWWRWVA